MTNQPHNQGRSELTDEELQKFFDEYEKRAEEFHKRFRTLDMKTETLTEAEQKESERMWRLFEQSKRVDAQHVFRLVQTYASILEAVATGSMGYADLELNAHYLKIVNLIRLFLASPQMKDCPVDFRPAVDHVLPGTGIDVAWDDMLLPEVHELLSKVQEYALSNAPFPNEEEGPLAIPPEVIATVCQRAIEAATRYRAEVERRFQGVVKRIEAKRLPGLNDRKAGWLVDTINSLLAFVHVHREQFLTDKELSTLDSLGNKMNRLAVALDLTTPDCPVYYSYWAEPLHGVGAVTNPTWPGGFTDRGGKSGFLIQPTAEWLNRIHELRDKAKTICTPGGQAGSARASAADGQEAGGGKQKSSGSTSTPAQSDGAPRDGATAASHKEEMRAYDEAHWRELEEAYFRGEVDPGHVNQAILWWLVGPKQYAIARLQGYPSEEEIDHRFGLSLETMARAAEAHGLNSAKIAKADHVLSKYGREALKILSAQGKEMDALAPIILNANVFPPGKGPNPQERAQFARGWEVIGRLNAINGQQLMAAAAREAQETKEGPRTGTASDAAKEVAVGTAATPAESASAGKPADTLLEKAKTLSVTPTDEERETAIGALLNPLVLIDTGLSNLHVRMNQLREENPHGAFSDTPPTKMTFAQQQGFQNRILAWTNPIQDAIKEAKAKCAGIAMHVTGVIDNPAMWETDLRTNLRLLGELICLFHQCANAATFEQEGQWIQDVGCQIYIQGTRLEDAYQTIEWRFNGQRLMAAAAREAQQAKEGPLASAGTAPEASSRLRRGPKPEVRCEDKTCRYIREHPGRSDITVDEIAQAIDYSRSMVAKTKHWKAYQKIREQEAENRRKALLEKQGTDDDFVGKR